MSVAARILEEELDGRVVVLAHARQAFAEALELLETPRSRWPRPRDPREELVVAIAVATLRTEGCMGRPSAARAAVLAVVDELSRRHANRQQGRCP